MTPHSFRHLGDQAPLRELSTVVARERANTAALLAHLAEADARQLYRPAGYPSMDTWCVQELRISEDEVFTYIRVARAAREFPAIFAAIETGSLNLEAVLLLIPFLNGETADDLLAAAAGKCNSEIERLLAECFPRPDVATKLERVSPCESAPQFRIVPLSPERFLLEVTLDQSTYEKLRHAEALLGDEIEPGDFGEVLHRALRALVASSRRRSS